jgi:ABC-type phosphate transport system permease subunit
MFSVLNSFIDGFFAIDIIMNFFTTYFHPTTGEEITEKKEIAINYLKGMFILDLLSTIPLDLLASTFYEQKGMQTDDM